MKKFAQDKDQKNPEANVPGKPVYEKDNSTLLKERSVVRQLAADYVKLGITSSGAIMNVIAEIPIIKIAVSKAMSAAKNIAINVFRTALGQAARVGGSTAGEVAAEGAVGTTLAVVFGFIEGYKTGAFIAPYIWGDMSNYMTKSSALIRLLEANMDREGAKKDPKIKALNLEMNRYQVKLSYGSSGLSEGTEKYSGKGMAVLQSKTPPLSDAVATSKHIHAVMEISKDLNDIVMTCKSIASEDFKKRFYDVHYVQGSWANPFSQDLNQMQSIAESTVSELNKVVENVGAYLATSIAFGDKLTESVDKIFEQEQPKATAKIIASFIKVANILSLYKW